MHFLEEPACRCNTCCNRLSATQASFLHSIQDSCLSPEVILIHNLLVLGQFAFSAAGSSLFHFDMLACLLPSSGVMSGIQWCSAAVFYSFFFSRLIETVFSKCDQAGTHHVESGQHGLNNLLNA